MIDQNGTKAWLTGYVYDSQTHKGISDVLVEIVGLAPRITDENGRYTFIEIDPGTHTIKFSHPDYQSVEIVVEIGDIGLYVQTPLSAGSTIPWQWIGLGFGAIVAIIIATRGKFKK
jgi:hypothetical protein